MEHLTLFEVDNNAPITAKPVADIPETGNINIFFSGADDYGAKSPNLQLKKTVIEYIDDRKIKGLGWKLFFVQQPELPIRRAFTEAANNDDPDIHLEKSELEGLEKNQRVIDYNSIEHHYSAEHVDFARNTLLPKEHAASLLDENGQRVASDEKAAEEVYKAKMRLSRFNLMGFCYGTITVQQVLLALDRELKHRGYNDSERKDIKSSLCCMNYAPICQIPDVNKDVPQVFFASGEDEITKRRINYSETYGKTCPEYDMHHIGSSVVLVSHLVAPLPKALRFTRTQYDHTDRLQTPLTINKNNDGYHASLDAIKKGKVQVTELKSNHAHLINEMKHQLRIWFNIERLTGTQLRNGKETFAFPSTLFARWAHDIVLDSVKASKQAAETGQPRDMKAIVDKALDSLTPEDIARRIEQFHAAEDRYATMVNAARENGSLVEKS